MFESPPTLVVAVHQIRKDEVSNESYRRAGRPRKGLGNMTKSEKDGFFGCEREGCGFR